LAGSKPTEPLGHLHDLIGAALTVQKRHQASALLRFFALTTWAGEDVVNQRRQALDAAMRSVEQTADPQAEAAIRIVAWVSGGLLKPTGDDFAMLRLVLLAILPQIGGVLLMIGRGGR
jgi:hypothetical protein